MKRISQSSRLGFHFIDNAQAHCCVWSPHCGPNLQITVAVSSHLLQKILECAQEIAAKMDFRLATEKQHAVPKGRCQPNYLDYLWLRVERFCFTKLNLRMECLQLPFDSILRSPSEKRRNGPWEGLEHYDSVRYELGGCSMFCSAKHWDALLAFVGVLFDYTAAPHLIQQV